MPAGLHSDTHLLARSRQITVKLLRLFAVRQPLFLKLSRVLIYPCDLLKLGVEIYSYNDSLFGSFLPSLLVGFSTTNFTRAGEPTLSWNQLRSKPLNERNGLVSTFTSLP
jgi:hypothetical protein